jgi:hypothetical protein
MYTTQYIRTVFDRAYAHIGIFHKLMCKLNKNTENEGTRERLMVV